MLPLRGIEPRLTGDDESATATELGGGGHGGLGLGIGLGFEGKGPGLGLKVRRGVRGRHDSRGWLARGARMAGGGGDTCGAPKQSREEERRLTGGPGRGKIKKTSLKFETKVFPS